MNVKSLFILVINLMIKKIFKIARRDFIDFRTEGGWLRFFRNEQQNCSLNMAPFLFCFFVFFCWTSFFSYIMSLETCANVILGFDSRSVKEKIMTVKL